MVISHTQYISVIVGFLVELLILASQFVHKWYFSIYILTILPFSSQWESRVGADSSRACGHECWHMYHISQRNSWCKEKQGLHLQKLYSEPPGGHLMWPLKFSAHKHCCLRRQKSNMKAELITVKLQGFALHYVTWNASKWHQVFIDRFIDLSLFINLLGTKSHSLDSG